MTPDEKLSDVLRWGAGGQEVRGKKKKEIQDWGCGGNSVTTGAYSHLGHRMKLRIPKVLFHPLRSADTYMPYPAWEHIT